VEGSSDVLLRDTLDLSQVFSCNSSFIREKDGENDTGSSEKSMLDAGKIVAEALKGIGNGGGHASMAGGFVPCTGSDMDVKLLEAQMKERFLAVIADVKKRAV
jgi:nanoRNase/pAp phosphatase (c-di-AMP/oligoRNAs hydrolase)